MITFGVCQWILDRKGIEAVHRAGELGFHAIQLGIPDVETVTQLARRECSGTGSRQFNSQRQPIETSANIGDERRRLRIDGKGRIVLPYAIDKQPTGRRGQQ